MQETFDISSDVLTYNISILVNSCKCTVQLTEHTGRKLQGVPRNMIIARRLESRLSYLNLFVTFSLLSTLTCMILETIIT